MDTQSRQSDSTDSWYTSHPLDDYTVETTFDVPLPAGMSVAQSIASVRINDAGLIAGYAVRSIPRGSLAGRNAGFTGFVYDSGTITLDPYADPTSAFDALYPHPFAQTSLTIYSALPLAESNSGNFVVGTMDGIGFGGSYIEQNGAALQLMAPGDSYWSPTAVNDLGEVVTSNGLLIDRGHVTNIDSDNVGLAPEAINDLGEVGGSYFQFIGSHAYLHGFIWYQGLWETYDVPGSTQTKITGINDSRQISGVYWDSNGDTHAFVADPNQPLPGNPSPPPPAGTLPPLEVLDEASNTLGNPAGVSSLSLVGTNEQYFADTPDNVIMSASTSGWWLRGGSGLSFIQISAAITPGSVNLLDSGDGSAFMVGDDNTDIFFTHASAADSWDTASNFHPGDLIQMWGVTKDFKLSWMYNVGNAQGLTLVAQSSQGLTAITLTGYSMQDIGTKIFASYSSIDPYGPSLLITTSPTNFPQA